MFEKEIKFIGDFCLNQVKHLGPHFTFEKITTTELHPAIVRYISAELDFMIYSDRRKLLQHSYFDYSGKKIAEHFIKINDEIKRGKRIAFDDAKKLILQAVSFNANYVVRPNWSLSQLIFNDQESIEFDELEMMLNYIYYYEHLKTILLAYLSKRKVTQVSKTEFDLTLKKIDEELIKSNNEKLIDNALSSIGDFFNIGGVERNLVSPMAMEIFLKEKTLFNYLLKLRKGISDSTKKFYTINTVKKTLYAPDITEEKKEEVAAEESDEVNLGELAEKHAKELDKTSMDDFINLEEEEALLALYEEELQDGYPEEGEVDVDEIKKDEVIDEVKADKGDQTDLLEKSEMESVLDEDVKEIEEATNEKEIVDEMMKDYFGGDAPKNGEPDESEEVEQEEKETTEIKTEPPATFEDELLNVFEDLDELSDDKIEEIEIATDKTAEQREDDSTVLSELDEEVEIIENDVSVVDESKNLVDELTVPVSVEESTSEMEKEKITEPEDENKKEEPAKDFRSFRKKDLFGYLTRKEMKKIVSHIFLKDEEDFTNTAEKIMDCGSYKEASDILKSVFTSYKVSPYSKDAVNFTNAVSNYFRQA